jgi:hypothetical protein
MKWYFYDRPVHLGPFWADFITILYIWHISGVPEKYPVGSHGPNVLNSLLV